MRLKLQLIIIQRMCLEQFPKWCTFLMPSVKCEAICFAIESIFSFNFNANLFFIILQKSFSVTEASHIGILDIFYAPLQVNFFLPAATETDVSFADFFQSIMTSKRSYSQYFQSYGILLYI